MNCPYCGKDMEKGYIKSSRRLFWSRGGELETVDENDLKLSKGFLKSLKGFFVGFSVESEYCKDCKKIIMEVREENA